jgi:hypothetical protein
VGARPPRRRPYSTRLPKTFAFAALDDAQLRLPSIPPTRFLANLLICFFFSSSAHRYHLMFGNVTPADNHAPLPTVFSLSPSSFFLPPIFIWLLTFTNQHHISDHGWAHPVRSGVTMHAISPHRPLMTIPLAPSFQGGGRVNKVNALLVIKPNPLL